MTEPYRTQIARFDLGTGLQRSADPHLPSEPEVLQWSSGLSGAQPTSHRAPTLGLRIKRGDVDSRRVRAQDVDPAHHGRFSVDAFAVLGCCTQLEEARQLAWTIAAKVALAVQCIVSTYVSRAAQLLTPNDQIYYQKRVNEHGPGDPARFAAAIKEITLRSGSSIALPTRGITAIVGPNNVGKSVLLDEIVGLVGRNNQRDTVGRILVDEIRVLKEGSTTDMAEWIMNHVAYYLAGSNQDGRFALTANHASLDNLVTAWENDFDGGLGALRNGIVDASIPVNRMGVLDFTERRSKIADAPSHPMHYLETDIALMDKFRQLCERVFRQTLTFDNLGRTIGLRLGRSEVAAPPVNAITIEYQEAIGSLPEVGRQGLGLKSLLGLLLPIVAGTVPIAIIDEPEAFLHPPQAFELGRILAKIATERPTQIILATHDKNILGGLLSATTDVTVVRLKRHGNSTTAKQLKASDLSEFWSDPILRYTNVLDGLFHRTVVVAEGDRDCRFYQAALDAAEAEADLGIATNEVQFLPANGKSGIAKFIDVLRHVGVQAVACVDFDVFQSPTDMRKLVESLGGDWSNYVDRYNACIQHLHGPDGLPTCAEVMAGIATILNRTPDEPWSPEIKERVRAATRLPTRWSTLKTLGVAAFEPDGREMVEQLVADLDKLGLRVVKEGELERLAPQVKAAKGAAWLEEAFAQGAHKSPIATAHVRRLIADITPIPSGQ